MTTAPAQALPAELTIYTVAALHPQWMPWLSLAGDNEHFTLDAAAVEEADAAGVQLLLSLSAALQRQGRALRLVGPSAALLATCEALGLADWARLACAEEQAA